MTKRTFVNLGNNFLLLVIFIGLKPDVFVPNVLNIALFFLENTTPSVLAYCLREIRPSGNQDINQTEVLMGGEETRHDLWMKRINTWIGILGGSIASVVGAYNFIPSTPGEIAAVIREQGGAPVPRVHVELLTSQNVLLGASETDRDGRYVKKDLQPGSYILKVSRAAFEPQVATVSIASKKTTDLELVLRSRSRSQASTTLQAASTSQHGDAIRSALEETGASLIKSLGKSRN